MLITADGKHIAAELGPAQHKAGKERQYDHVEHRICDAEKPGAAAQRQQLVVIGSKLENDGVVGRNHRQAARNRQHS